MAVSSRERDRKSMATPPNQKEVARLLEGCVTPNAPAPQKDCGDLGIVDTPLTDLVRAECCAPRGIEDRIRVRGAQAPPNLFIR